MNDFEKWKSFLDSMNIEYSIDNNRFGNNEPSISIDSKHICECSDSVIIDFKKDKSFSVFEGWGE